MVNIINSIFKNPLVIIIGFNILLGFAGAVYVVLDRMKMKLVALLFSDTEGLYEPIAIDGVTSKSLHSSRRDMRFFRTGKSYKHRARNQIIWLAKYGKGYIMRLKSGKKDKAENLGTLWEGLNVILGEELVEQFSEEVKKKLIDSRLLLVVELETPPFPEEYEEMTEEDISNANASQMAGLIFSQVKEQMKEDYIKILGILCAGALIWEFLQKVGVL